MSVYHVETTYDHDPSDGRAINVKHTVTETHAGLVLAEGEETSRWSMDTSGDCWEAVYYADVWDHETASVKRVHYHHGRPAPARPAVVDAPADVVALAVAWTAEQARLREERIAAEKAEQEDHREARDALDLERGRKAVVHSGRKAPIGTCGVVVWVGESGGQWGGRRVGLAVTEARNERGQYADVIWLDAANVMGLPDAAVAVATTGTCPWAALIARHAKGSFREICTAFEAAAADPGLRSRLDAMAAEHATKRKGVRVRDQEERAAAVVAEIGA